MALKLASRSHLPGYLTGYSDVAVQSYLLHESSTAKFIQDAIGFTVDHLTSLVTWMTTQKLPLPHDLSLLTLFTTSHDYIICGECIKGFAFVFICVDRRKALKQLST
jgi:hypothetical protein